VSLPVGRMGRSASPLLSAPMPDSAKNSSDLPVALAARIAQLNAHKEMVASLCEQGGIDRFGFESAGFTVHLARSVASRFKGQTPSSQELESYLGTFHLEDFVLACACSEGSEAAWNIFVQRYRGYLRTCAAVMLKRGSDAPEAVELADSLFAELYGLADGRRGAGSLFRYFHGRSSLKTWLRAVLAQRHVDSIRAARRFDSLEEEDGAAWVTDGGLGNRLAHRQGDLSGPTSIPADPYREKYIGMFCAALRCGLEKLDSADHRRIALYYAADKTLAEVGYLCGEHESSVSRNLERIRRELRLQVEEHLRRGTPEEVSANGATGSTNGLSDAQIAVCFQYATEDAPIDFDLLFPGGVAKTENASEGKIARREPGRQDS
jgi:RNA polymerase sigma factor (sigma-70 family)